MSSGEGHKMWGGRFASGPAELMREINSSIGVDKRFWREDVAGSKAHAIMLRDQGIISPADAEAILTGLDRIAAEYEQDGVPEDPALEDIHMHVEARPGPVAGRAAALRAVGLLPIAARQQQAEAEETGDQPQGQLQ